MIMHVVGASALILVAAQAAGWLAGLLKQPFIVGQLAAGIALGPSLLGSVVPGLYDAVFPASIAPTLSGFAQISLVVCLFVVGYELDLNVLGDRARSVVGVTVAAFALPMAVGCGCALLFRAQLHTLGMPALSPAHVLFAGIALSITAVPVLTAIVRENGLTRTVPGVVAVSAAGLLDVVGWTVLAGILLDGGAGQQSLDWPWRALIFVGFVALMLVAARPLLRRLLWRTHVDPTLRMALLVGFALGSAFVTDALGLQVIFGALLAGVVVPREEDGSPDPALLRPLRDVSALLLPFFFVISGQSVTLAGMTGTGWVTLLVVTALAVVTKVGGSTVAARLSGLERGDARTVGVLMSTRGLTELIALNAGFQAGLLSKPLYTVLVFMALATTLFTQPLLGLVRRQAERERPAPPAQPPPPPHEGKDGPAPQRPSEGTRATPVGDAH